MRKSSTTNIDNNPNTTTPTTNYDNDDGLDNHEWKMICWIDSKVR